jgi:hypothetical protein
MKVHASAEDVPITGFAGPFTIAETVEQAFADPE